MLCVFPDFPLGIVGQIGKEIVLQGEGLNVLWVNDTELSVSGILPA